MFLFNVQVEDLQAMLERKNASERQLSLEKSNLENSYEEEAKQKERVEMQVFNLRTCSHYDMFSKCKQFLILYIYFLFLGWGASVED